jgi:hypothetical protein
LRDRERAPARPKRSEEWRADGEVGALAAAENAQGHTALIVRDEGDALGARGACAEGAQEDGAPGVAKGILDGLTPGHSVVLSKEEVAEVTRRLTVEEPVVRHIPLGIDEEEARRERAAKPVDEGHAASRTAY